jgi:hypothetical protein
MKGFPALELPAMSSVGYLAVMRALPAKEARKIEVARL